MTDASEKLRMRLTNDEGRPAWKASHWIDTCTGYRLPLPPKAILPSWSQELVPHILALPIHSKPCASCFISETSLWYEWLGEQCGSTPSSLDWGSLRRVPTAPSHRDTERRGGELVDE